MCALEKGNRVRFSRGLKFGIAQYIDYINAAQLRKYGNSWHEINMNEDSGIFWRHTWNILNMSAASNVQYRAIKSSADGKSYLPSSSAIWVR